MKGDATQLCGYPPHIKQVSAICTQDDDDVYACCREEHGGVLKFNKGSGAAMLVLANYTNICKEVVDISLFQGGLLFTDIGSHQIKLFKADQVQVLAGSAQEGIADDPAKNAAFCQVMGICTEGYNIYYTDSQAGCVKHLTTMKGIVSFLKHLGSAI